MLLLSKIKKYISEQKLYGVLFSKLDEYCNTIQDINFDPIFIFSGFTGSNAFILITVDKNILFTDKRYYQRAETETDFEIIYEDVYQWISLNLPLNQKIAIEPSKHIYQKIKKIEQHVFLDPGLKFFYPQISDIKENIIKISEENRIPYISEFLFHNNAFAAILTPENFSWAKNIRDLNKQYNKSVSKFGIQYNNDILELEPNNIHKLTKIISGKTICADYNAIPYSIIKEFENHATVKNKSLSALQAIKTNDEIEGFKLANTYERDNFIKIVKWIQSSISDGKKINENDVCEKLLEIKSANKEFLGESFETICGYGPNSSIIHYSSKNSPSIIKNGDLLLIDSGSHYTCGTTDITRTIAIGTPTKQQKNIFTIILKALLKASMQKIPINSSGQIIDIITRSTLWNNGMDYPHSTGHGIGFIMNVHELGAGFYQNAPTLQPGMVISIEPGYYLEKKFGVRLENNIYISKLDDKFLKLETLSKIPFDNTLIEESMLNKEELKFIKTFR